MRSNKRILNQKKNIKNNSQNIKIYLQFIFNNNLFNNLVFQ